MGHNLTSIVNLFVLLAVITLNCRVSGYPVDTHYPIRISMNELVGELQSVIKKRWDPLFSHIVYDELKLMPIKELLNNPINSEPENSMKSLNKISSDFSRFNYTYNPSHLHVLVSSANWKEVHCRLFFDHYEKTIQWRVNRDMVTLVRLRDELRKCFSVLDGVENRNINLYKSDNMKNEGVLLESDTML